MELRLERRWPKATYTVGRLYADGDYFCNTLEDTDRGLSDAMKASEIESLKVYGETAIPRGRYEVSLRTPSPKYSQIPWYRELTGGYMPRLLCVKGFEGVLIHPGNTAADTLGCILVGQNTAVGRLTQSRDTFAALYRMMKAAAGRGERIFITIV